MLETCRRWLTSNWLLVLLLAISIARLWVMPLPSSFWTDEAGTAFIVQRPADPDLAPMASVITPVYYALPRAAAALFGFSEVAYRIPSLLTMGIALFFIARIAARLIDPEAAWFAVFACLAIGDFNYYADDARPYALGIAICAASIYFLIKWLDTARWAQALLFVFFAALLWRVQLVFWSFYPVLLIYTIMRLVRSTTRVGWLRATGVWLLVGVALIPVVVQALAARRDANAHIISVPPGFRALIKTSSWEVIALCAAAAWLWGSLSKWQPRIPASRSSAALILSWWIWMPLCLFVYSRTTETVLFIPRYFSLALPGAALVATAAAAIYVPRGSWKYAAAILAVAGLAATGHWSVLAPDHTVENWRQASSDVDLAAEEPDTPVIAVSPFIEMRPPLWNPDYRLPSFFYSPLFVYPVRGRIYPFPFALSPDTARYAENLLRDTLSKRNRFIVYGAGRNTLRWLQWISERPELKGWTQNAGSSVDAARPAIVAVTFDKPGL